MEKTAEFNTGLLQQVTKYGIMDDLRWTYNTGYFLGNQTYLTTDIDRVFRICLLLDLTGIKMVDIALYGLILIIVTIMLCGLQPYNKEFNENLISQKRMNYMNLLALLTDVIVNNSLNYKYLNTLFRRTYRDI